MLMGIDPDSEPARRISDWTTTAGSIGVLVAAGGVAFFALLRRRVGDGVALLSTLALFLGSLIFPYATALFAHAGTVALLTVALWAVLDEGPAARRARRYVGGVCAGLAFASEYPAIIPVTVLFCYLAYADRDRARRFAIALVPGVLLILLKNFLSTGSPFELLYGSNPQFPHESAARGFGHTLPQLHVASDLLWSEYRGLFFWNPILLMALPGAIALVRAESRGGGDDPGRDRAVFPGSDEFSQLVRRQRLWPALSLIRAAVSRLCRRTRHQALAENRDDAGRGLGRADDDGHGGDDRSGAGCENAAEGHLPGAARTGPFRAQPRDARRTFAVGEPVTARGGHDGNRVAHHGGVVSIAPARAE